MHLFSLFSKRQVKKTWLIRIHRCHEATNLKCFPRKIPSASEALKENAEALSTEEPSQALWKKKDGMWRRWENMLWHKEELWNAINTNEQDLFFVIVFVMIGLYSFRRGYCYNRMRLHYSLLGVSIHTLCLHICGMMYILYIEGSDRASSPCLSWQFCCATCFYLDLSLVWNLQYYPWHPNMKP